MATDIQDISEAGLDKFGARLQEEKMTVEQQTPRTLTASKLTGGQIGDFVIGLGANQIRLDSKNKRIVVNDGTNDRVIIGRRVDGTYGIDVSSVGYDVNEAYEGEMDLSSKSKDGWTELNPNNFTYLSTTSITVANYLPSMFSVGDKLKIRVDVDDYYFYVVYYDVGAGTITVYGDAVPNAIFDNVYVTKETNPSGHPIWFSISSTLQAHDQAHTITNQGTFVGGMFMQGNTVYATYNRDSFTLGTTPDYFLHEDLPVARDTTYRVTAIGDGGDSVATASYLFPIRIAAPCSAASASDTLEVEIARTPYAVWALSSSSHMYFNLIYKAATPAA